jgi:type I restriction enzyme R subunit
MSATPSFLEDRISQIPALQLLQNLGYVYLRPQEVFLERKGRLSNFLLEDVLEKQLRRLNRIRFKGSEYEFSDANIQAAIETLKDVPFDGLVRTSEKIYDLLSLGKSFEQTVAGDTKSFTIQYVDWQSPANNVFHVAEEFEVERVGSHQTCRPDIVLFVNGIPFVVIECKRPDIKGSLKEAISQQIRNQSNDHIPRLFTFAQILLAITKNEASYGTTGTSAKFWSIWREETDVTVEVGQLVNRALSREQKERLFADRPKYVRHYFDEKEVEAQEVTEQDRALYCLCRPERLLEISYKFIVFDAGEKKIARYQQYFAVRNTLERIKHRDEEGQRKGGVIWHTQGSGKSLTMVMLAKAIALDPEIQNPKIVLVTDRVDLDDQLYRTFHHSGKEPVRARTGKHLMELLRGNKEAIIATTIFKFETGVKAQNFRDEGANIFVLVDESHRTQSGSRGEQYGKAHEKMRRVLPKACYIGFTGTPLMKKEKNTARQFGGFIDTYTIRRAVEDKAVVPLLYEGRHVVQEVDEKAIDKWFEIVTKPLTPAQRADLKRKFSTADQLNKADRKIYLMAFDVSEHFRQNWKGTGFKAQLTADLKASALKFKEYLDEFGQVTSEVLISGPDTREGNEEVDRVGTDEVQAFWKRMMDKYGGEDAYNKQIINAFRHDDDPEIIIVVDKLLTGFDAPRNTVLYLARSMKEHGLLQAIARVNRLWEGKDFGYVIDYYGVLSELGEALELYGALPEFDQEDLEDALTDIRQEIEKLPQKHSELWDIFKSVKNRMDEEAYELELAKEDVRQKFYTKLSAYSRALGIALSTVQFNLETPEDKIERYKKDLAFFQKLRVSVKKRYSDEIDYKEYEAKVQKLINTHVSSEEILQITPPVNIFEQEKFQAEVEKLQTAASKADTIAHRTKKTITEKMEEDPYFYRRFSKILEEAIEAYREQRISDAEYLSRVTEIMNSVVNRAGDDLPSILKNQDVAKAFYGVVNEVFTRLSLSGNESKEVAARAALQIDEIIRRNKVVDWIANLDAQNAMRNEIDDYLYELREESGIELSLDDMDLIVENSIDIAKARYA